MRLNLDESEMLEDRSTLCHDAYTGVLSAQRHRLHALMRESLIEETLVQKLERELDMEETRIKSIAISS